jgi:hypothetical protein
MIFPVALVWKRNKDEVIWVCVSVCTPSKNLKAVGVTMPPKFGRRGAANVTVPATNLLVV